MRTLLALLVVGIACTRDPYDAYAGAVRYDTGASQAAISRTVTRLQSTVVHGHVPADSAKVWSETLARASRELTQHADHLERLGPPDGSLSRTHLALLMELRQVADTMTAIAGSVNDPATVGDVFARLLRGTEYTQDELRWTQQRAARQLATHGIIL
jgi:hypothetical protein